MTQGVIIRVITTGNPDEMLFRQSLDALNYMMADQRIPQVRVDFLPPTGRYTSIT